MADTKISGLSAVTDVQATDEFVLARSSTTKKIDAVDLAAGIVALADSHAFYQDQKSSGTAGGTFTSGAWQTRVLNTEVYDPAGIASVASNQITLAAAGTYRVRWTAPAAGVNGHQTRLRDITNSVTLAPGGSMVAASGAFVVNSSDGEARFTVSGSTVIELQHQCQSTKTTDGFGASAAFTVDYEVFAQVWVTKE